MRLPQDDPELDVVDYYEPEDPDDIDWMDDWSRCWTAEPDRPRVPKAFLRALEQEVSTWSLPITSSDIHAEYLDGRLWVVFDVVQDNCVVADLRADVTDEMWIAAWVSPGCALAYEPEFQDAHPQHEPVRRQVTDPDQDVADLVEWLRTQLEAFPDIPDLPAVRQIERDSAGHVRFADVALRPLRRILGR